MELPPFKGQKFPFQNHSERVPYDLGGRNCRTRKTEVIQFTAFFNQMERNYASPVSKTRDLGHPQKIVPTEQSNS